MSSTSYSGVLRVQDPNETWLEMAESWLVPRALMGGVRQMREEGRTYLPQFPKETDQAYLIRLRATEFYPAFPNAIRNLAGRVFSKPVTLEPDVPEIFRRWAENIDLTGRGMDNFAYDVFVDGVTYGLSHVLIDMPNGAAATLADERAMGMRPYWVHVKAHDLIGWRAEVINGRYVLTQARIREQYVREAGDFGEHTIERIRLLFPGGYQLWDAVDGNEYALVEEGTTSINYIPLVTFYADRVDHMLARPPLEDLAHLNVTHWQSSSDQRHILHVARVPILHGSGFPDEFDTSQVGPNVLIRSPEGSKLEYVEHSGAGIGAGRQDLMDLEDKMQRLSLAPLLPGSGTVTATQSAIDASEANSRLQQMALSLQDTLEQAMQTTGNWLGIDGDKMGSVRVNIDYGLSMRDGTDIESLIKLRAAGDISADTMWAELKRRGVLMDSFDAEVEAQRIGDTTLPEM